MIHPGHIVIVRRVTGHQGRVLYRPVNEVSKGFALLLNQKTLTALDLERIKDLGFEVRIRVQTETKIETEEIL